jgi:hypothetical protein
MKRYIYFKTKWMIALTIVLHIVSYDLCLYSRQLIDSVLKQVLIFWAYLPIDPFSYFFNILSAYVSQADFYRSEQVLVGRGKVRRVRRLIKPIPIGCVYLLLNDVSKTHFLPFAIKLTFVRKMYQKLILSQNKCQIRLPRPKKPPTTPFLGHQVKKIMSSKSLKKMRL